MPGKRPPMRARMAAPVWEVRALARTPRMRTGSDGGGGQGKAWVVGGRRVVGGSVRLRLFVFAAESASSGDLLGGATGERAELAPDGGGEGRGLKSEVLADHGAGEILAGGAGLHEGDGGRDGDRVDVEVPAGGVPAEDLGEVLLGARGEVDAGADGRGTGGRVGGGEDAGHAEAFLGDAAEGGAAHGVIWDDMARADRWLQHGGVVLGPVIRGTHADGGG